MVSICISLRMNAVKALFMCLLAISLSLGESDCSHLLPVSQWGYMFYHWFVKLIYIIWVQVPYSYMICKYFPRSSSSLFTFWMVLFAADNVFRIWQSPIYLFLFSSLALRKHCLTQRHDNLLLCFLLRVLYLSLFRSEGFLMNL